MVVGISLPWSEADASIGLGVSPSKLELGLLSPGDEIRRQFTLKATGDSDTTIEIDMKDYVLGPKEEFEYLPAGSVSASSSSWITITPSKLTLAAGRTGTVDFRMRVPADATGGGRYTALMFNFSGVGKPDSAGGSSAAIRDVAAIAVQVLARVSGDVQAVGTTSSSGSSRIGSDSKDQGPLAVLSRLDLPFLHEPGSIAIRSRFEVKGNAHLNVASRTWIRDIFGNNLAEIVSGPFTVLPGSARTIEARWDNSPPLGIFFAYMQVEDSAETNYGEPHRYFFVIAPWKTAAVTLPVLVTAGWVLRTFVFAKIFVRGL